jgi:glycosyltransferase involved in cell wall biosynthesis
MTSPVDLSIVVPCFNEAEILDQFYRELKSVLDTLALSWRLVFVDDGSTDETLDRLNALAQQDGRVLVYSLSRNFGHQVALSAGLDATTGPVLMMDADLQHPPSLVPEMVSLWQRGHDIVSAVRRNTDEATWFKRVTADAFYRIINWLGDTQIVPGAADFCLLSERAHRALNAMPERHRFLRGMISWIGFNRAFVPFDAPKRPAGKSKYTTVRMMFLALDGLLSFSAAPMRMATRLGLALVVPGVIYFIYVMVRYVALNDFVRGWGSLIGTLLIVSGIQLVCIGIVGEYLARIFEESKRRPLYFFKQEPQPDAATRCV